MSHTAETYREAALEHVALARVLHVELQEYGAAHYWAGLAVECMLRAYRLLLDQGFDSRHDLRELVRQGRFNAFVPEELAPRVAASLQEVARRWSNDHRFRPTRMVERWLRDQRLDWAVSGDRLKYSSDKIVAAASYLVQVGEQQWRSRTS